MDEYLNQQTRANSFSFNEVAQFLFVLFVAKFFKSFGIYLCYDLLKQIHIVQLLFFVSLVATLFFIVLQRPFSSHPSASLSSDKGGARATSSSSSQRTAPTTAPAAKAKSLNRYLYFRILKYSFVQTVIRLLWLFGLTQCGPLRTTLIFEQSDIVILCALKAIFLSQTTPTRSRGVLLLLTGTLILLAFDYDAVRAKIVEEHPEGRHHGIISHLFFMVVSWFNVSDHKAGVLLLFGALFIQIAYSNNSSAKVLVSDLGGAKRLRALSLMASTLVLSPWAIFNMISPSSAVSEADPDLVANAVEHSWLYYLLPILMIALFIFVVDFYIESYVIAKTEHAYASKFGAMFAFTCSLFLSFIWNHPHLVKVMVMDKIKTIIEQEHALSWGVLITFILYFLATEMLSRPLSKHKGSFIGYSSVGNPLYSLTGESLKRTSMSMVTVIRNILREIVTHTDSRRIFYFLCVNLSFTFVELIYGAFSNSLGLISDGFHMLFDCSALVMGLFAAVVSQWKPTRIYSYGFGRLEILSGFINGLFLVVIAVFVFIEAVSRLFEPPEIKSEKLLIVSFMGLCVNLFGMFAFSHAHSHGGVPHNHSHSSGGGGGHEHSHAGGGSHSHGNSHGHSHGGGSSSCSSSSHPSTETNDNMRGVYLHVLADTLGSVGVIISSFLIQQFGWYIADPLCSMCMSVMIFLSVTPLLKHSSSVLLLRTPVDKEKQMNLVLQRILAIEGVISYRDDHLWQQSSSSFVATLHVQIMSNAPEQVISMQINSLLKEMKLANLTVQVEKEVFFQHLLGLGANMGQINESKRIYKTASSSGDPANPANSSFINIEKFV